MNVSLNSLLFAAKAAQRRVAAGVQRVSPLSVMSMLAFCDGEPPGLPVS